MNIPDYFNKAEDYRLIGRCWHKLSEILGLVLVGLLADCDDFLEITDYCESNIDYMRSDLGFILPNGIPSEDTLERVFKHLKTEEIESCFRGCLGAMVLSGKQLNIDGKELRNTIPKGKKHALVRMVNVWVCEDGLSFGQLKVEKKSNEIVAIPEILKAIDCKGSVISIDAIGCQKEIVSILREKEADYVIGLKRNQGELYDQARDFMTRNKEKLPSTTLVEKDHGRGEIRKVYVADKIDLIDERDNWKDLKSVIMIERTRIIGEETQVSTGFYISSLENQTPSKMADYVRKHWSIENKLHWHLDVTFKEDNSKVKNQKAVVNLHQMRKWALFLLSKDKTPMSMKRKRKKAHRDNSYLMDVIFQKF